VLICVSFFRVCGEKDDALSTVAQAPVPRLGFINSF
jgi:hypothetical protein